MIIVVTSQQKNHFLILRKKFLLLLGCQLLNMPFYQVEDKVICEPDYMVKHAYFSYTCTFSDLSSIPFPADNHNNDCSSTITASANSSLFWSTVSHFL
jgi:hypothetical protein